MAANEGDGPAKGRPAAGAEEGESPSKAPGYMATTEARRRGSFTGTLPGGRRGSFAGASA